MTSEHDQSEAAKRASRRRTAAGIGSALAAVVAVVFATVGDGVGPKGEGWRLWVIEYGHTLTWILLSLSLALVAWGRVSARIANGIGVAALVSYIAFLATLFTTPAA
jgi:hypothetical protein